MQESKKASVGSVAKKVRFQSGLGSHSQSTGLAGRKRGGGLSDCRIVDGRWSTSMLLDREFHFGRRDSAHTTPFA